MEKHKYPFTYKLDDNINLHIEYFDNFIICIWFDNDNNEEIDIPNGFFVYNKIYTGKGYENKLMKSFRNTQTFAIAKSENYIIEYNNKNIINLKTTMYCTEPPIIEDDIIVL